MKKARISIIIGFLFFLWEFYLILCDSEASLSQVYQ